MLFTLKKSSISLTHIVTGVTAALMTASLFAPTLAQQQSEKQTRELSESTGMHHEQLGVYESIVRNRLEDEAKTTIVGASRTVAAYAAKADPTAAKTAIAGLDSYQKLDDSKLRSTIDSTKAASDALAAAAAEADRQAAAAAAAALANANTPDGAKSVARSQLAQHGWGDDQFSCLSNLWQKESGWNYQAYNAGSGATGIPQALPGNKMASAGSDWQSNAATQIAWGLDYISRSYGTPCSAWSHSQSVNWY
ncbi:hypothetical protein ACIRCZ_02920 [Leifsonia sp. NPDC102414]|uniref:aggregation-promoting factor C-terminal-like domain-containing protein n=1 Tax=Leifsonia sp. NPDC102414 TaxID=3364124 RepID=UPI0037FF860A